MPYAPTRIRTRPFHLIRALAAEGHRVTLGTLWGNRAEFEAIQGLSGDLEAVLSEKIHLTRSIWNCVRALPGRSPIQAHYSWSPKLARQTARIVKAGHFDAIHVEHLRGVRYGLLLQEILGSNGTRRPAMVWDSVDCISSLFRQAAHRTASARSRLTVKMELPRTENYEGWLTTRFDRVLVTSENDRRELSRLAERWHRSNGAGPVDGTTKRITVVPNGVDLDYFSPSGETREPQTLVITGKMSYHANVTAVVRFVNDVMPKVWAQLPDVRLWIVGKDPPREVQSLGVAWKGAEAARATENRGRESRIQITGTVDDIRPFLRRATLAVAPIHYGAGVQNKVLEALACGTPVVATPEAVNALQVHSGRELVVARDTEEFAWAVISLLSNPRRRTQLGEAGRSFVEQQHEWRSIVRGLTQVYRDARQ